MVFFGFTNWLILRSSGGHAQAYLCYQKQEYQNKFFSAYYSIPYLSRYELTHVKPVTRHEKYDHLKTYFPNEFFIYIDEVTKNNYKDQKLFFNGAMNMNGVKISAVPIPKSGNIFW